MAALTMTFTERINVSLQVGDIVYYANTTSVGGFNESETIVEMGSCIAVTDFTIECNIDNSTPRPTVDSFIMFSKDMRVSTSGLTGYYAEVEMKNNSNTKSELFSVGSEVVASSK
jgi:hypothetical protein